MTCASWLHNSNHVTYIFVFTYVQKGEWYVIMCRYVITFSSSCLFIYCIYISPHQFDVWWLTWLPIFGIQTFHFAALSSWNGDRRFSSLPKTVWPWRSTRRQLQWANIRFNQNSCYIYFILCIHLFLCSICKLVWVQKHSPEKDWISGF